MTFTTDIRMYSPAEVSLPTEVADALKSLRSDLMKIGGVRSVVLFGSYSKGTYGPESDIDVAVFLGDNTSLTERDIYRKATRLAGKYPLDIQILVFQEYMLVEPAGIIGEIIEFGCDLSTL